MYNNAPAEPFTDEQDWFDHFEGKLIAAWEEINSGESFITFCDKAWKSYKESQIE